MGTTNSDFWVKEYTDDFGKIHPNYKFKLSNTAPNFDTIKSIASYEERTVGVSCGSSALFKHRRLKATFATGRSIEYPVPNPALLDEMIADLIDGEGDNVAVCIDLIGERWNYVPAGVLGLTQDKFRKTPITDAKDTGSKKESYTYSYNSEIPSVGKILVPFSVHIDSKTLHDCQLEGMTDWKLKGEEIIPCSAKSLGIDPRHFTIKSVIKFDGGNATSNQFQAIRMAPVSGDSGLLFSDKAKAVAAKLAACGYCLGWKGETAKNIHLLIA